MTRTAAALFLVYLLAASSALAQATGGIRGRVLDQTNAALPGATVTVTNAQTGLTRDTTTDGGGYYAVASLPLTGTYTVRITLAGFGPKEVGGIDLRGGETATVDATLSVTTAGSVTVYGTTQGIRSDEPQLGVTLDSEKIEQTPIVGRKFTNIPLLDSAVKPSIQTGDTFLNNTLFVVNGSGRRQTTYSLDGSTADDAWGRQTIFTTVPLSAIQEFTVLSNAFSAEYGRTTGAAVNIVTKSGTNRTAGDFVGLFRPAAAESALSIPNVLTPKTRDVLGQASGSAGGPIAQNRTFYFVSAEFNHQLRDSIVSSPLGPAGTLFTGTYNQGLLDARVDHQVTDGQRFTVKGNIDAFHDTNPGGVVGGLALSSAGRTFDRHAYGLQLTHTATFGSSLLNDARFQVFYGSPITQFQPVTSSTQYVYPGYATIGESRFADLFNHQFELADTVTIARGRHDLRIGANVIRSHSGGNGQEFGSPFVLGQFTVKPGVTRAPADLTAADIQQFTQGFGTTTYTVTDWIWDVYAQDDIKLRSDLTVNLGLRYDRQTFTDDTNNVGPRAGFTYNVAGDPKTVVRGGYGLFYSQVRADAAAGWLLNGPTGFYTFSAAPGQLGFPASLTPLSSLPAGAILPPRNITIRPGMASYYNQFFDVSKLKGYPDALLNPYTQSGTIGIERALGHAWFLSADYVKQHTAGIDRPLDLNSPAPFVRTAPGQVRSASAADLTRPIVPLAGGYRQIVTYVNDGVADYDGLQLNLRKSTTSYSVLASYTLSKATNTVEPDVPQQAPNDPNFTGEAERGPSLLDQRHRFVLSGSVHVPYDFSVGGVATAASPYHYNITTGADNNGDGSNTDRPVVNGVVMGRNAGVGSAIYDLTLFAQRDFAFAGQRALSLRVELFNAFNHANIAGYNGTYGNAATGVPAAALGTPLTGIANLFPGRELQVEARVRF